MTGNQRIVSILLGVAGAVISSLAMAGFLLRVWHNNLELPSAATSQAFYQSVGKAYSGGFVAGFALCFSLMLLAVAIGTWFDGRRRTQAMPTESVRMPLVDPPTGA